MKVVDPNSAVGKVLKNGGKPYVTPEDGVVMEWWKSKKFVSYMWGDFTWKVILLVILYVIETDHNGVLSGSWLTIMFSIIVTAGVIQMGFMGGQAWIDRYTQAIRIPAELGSSVVGSVTDSVVDATDEDMDALAPTAPDSLNDEDMYDEEEYPPMD